MRLYPPVSEEEALLWLTGQAVSTWGAEKTKQIEPRLKSLAQALSAVSNKPMPVEMEPLFP